MLTFSEAKSKLADYAPANLIGARINRACELLLTLSRPKDFLDRVTITAYNSHITLPRQYSTCVGIIREEYSIPIRNSWVEFILEGPGLLLSDDSELCGQIIDLGDGYVCFKEPGWVNEDGCTIRFDTDAGTGEVTPANINVRGLLDGVQLRTTAGGTTYYGDKLSMIDGADVTTTQSYDTLTQVSKPVTVGEIIAYAIDPDDASASEIARYAPGETLPSYRRYKVPESPTGAATYTLVALCQRRFVEAVDDDDRLSVSNLSALENALLHLHYRLENDDERADRCLNTALRIIQGETAKFKPAGQYPMMVNYNEGAAVRLKHFY